MKIILIIILIASLDDCKERTIKNIVKLYLRTSVDNNNTAPKHTTLENKEAERKHKHKKHEDNEKYYYWDKDERWEKKQRKKNRDKNRYKDSDSDEDWYQKEKKYWNSEESEYKYDKKKIKKYYEDWDIKKDRDKYLEMENYWDQDKEQYWSSGSKAHIFDIKGNLRKRFAYECMEALNGRSSVCSPFSALKPLGILAFGAEGSTLDEILREIGVTHISSVNHHFNNILSVMQQANGLHMASRVYVHNNRRLQDAFKDQAENVFGSCIEQINLRDKDKTTYEVNSWADYHTNHRIKQIIAPRDISANAVAIIVDAIYFWGQWKHPFTHMKSETFYGTSASRSATMMCHERKYKYGQSSELNAQVIEIPYENREMKMIIVLPRNKNGVGSLIRQLKHSPELINNVRMSETKVHLQLPKFQIETSLNLISLYQRIGLRHMFNPHEGRGGLTKVLTNEKVFVSNGIQKVFVLIDQEGTEGGGGLGASLYPTEDRKPQGVVFNANHPFIFFITLSKQQLFAGVLQ